MLFTHLLHKNQFTVEPARLAEKNQIIYPQIGAQSEFPNEFSTPKRKGTEDGVEKRIVRSLQKKTLCQTAQNKRRVERAHMETSDRSHSRKLPAQITSR